jgi:hypothetical protein
LHPLLKTDIGLKKDRKESKKDLVGKKGLIIFAVRKKKEKRFIENIVIRKGKR